MLWLFSKFDLLVFIKVFFNKVNQSCKVLMIKFSVFYNFEFYFSWLNKDNANARPVQTLILNYWRLSGIRKVIFKLLKKYFISYVIVKT